MSLGIRTPTRLFNNVKIFARSFSASPKRMSDDEVLFEVHGNTGLITLNRPKALNALNLSMIRVMHPVMNDWENDPNIGLIMMKGAGEKAFCAGGDVKCGRWLKGHKFVAGMRVILMCERYSAIALERQTGGDLREMFFKEEYILNNDIGNLKTPFIAMISGITMGGGVGLSVHGLHRVATEKSLFAMPETAIGLFPDVGGGHFLPRLPGKLGLFLALTGHRLKGRDVLHSGVATHFVDSKELPYLEEELLKLSNPTKDSISNILSHYHEKCDNRDETFSLQPHVDTINNTFSKSSLEDIFKALEDNGSEWCIKQLDTLKKMVSKLLVQVYDVGKKKPANCFTTRIWRHLQPNGTSSFLILTCKCDVLQEKGTSENVDVENQSPISMKVAFRQLEEGSKMTLSDDLIMEYRISQECMAQDDFFEGIRAVLIDRDHSPKWQHSSIEEITQETLDSYFAPLPNGKDLVL